MSDRIQINSLERAASGDINNLQSMATRIVAELAKYTQARKIEGPLAFDLPRSFTGGLNLFSDGGNNALLSAGVLAQLSPTWPAAPGPLDSDLRLGFLDGPLPVTLPVPGGPTIVSLEGQVVDVVTVQLTRDIFDVPTQTFIPTLVDKQIERQIQTQFVLGDAINAPAPSGDPWVLLYTLVVQGGVAAPLAAFFITDMRPEVNNGEQSNAVGSFLGDGQIIRGSHPFFWGGLMLVDSGEAPQTPEEEPRAEEPVLKVAPAAKAEMQNLGNPEKPGPEAE